MTDKELEKKIKFFSRHKSAYMRFKAESYRKALQIRQNKEKLIGMIQQKGKNNHLGG